MAASHRRRTTPRPLTRLVGSINCIQNEPNSLDPNLAELRATQPSPLHVMFAALQRSRPLRAARSVCANFRRRAATDKGASAADARRNGSHHGRRQRPAVGGQPFPGRLASPQAPAVITSSRKSIAKQLPKAKIKRGNFRQKPPVVRGGGG